ncbi:MULTISPECIES: hypothetical protein [Pseudomonas syringae group genomosp. 2]|uniref:hypothetical protein n=1 Tax=Pseudomonas syringae group genomosp. 2 TaxID=251698 RepID=UPI0006980970|nr:MULTISPECIES: hypothetical protein [Pseudomonas syringae group genomosp. 2]QOI03400.1 hypothetical protein D5S10_05595 [Pseudomonas savastanoi]
MRYLEDSEPVIFEDRLHYMIRFDPRPEGTPYNDYDPFSPYYFCPDGMGFGIVYQDIVELLKDLTTGEVAEIRRSIISFTDDAGEQYRAYLEDALPGRDADDYDVTAKYMRENRQYELLKMFTPKKMELSTGNTFSETQLWAVYALEEFQLALDCASTPPFADDRKALAESGYIEDMLETAMPGIVREQSDLDKARRAVHRQRHTMMDAGMRLVLATKHIQYALILSHSNVVQQERAEALAKKDSRMKGLNEINRLKEQAMEKALSFAESRWNEDVNQSIRIGDMAVTVYRCLVDIGLHMALPDTSERLKEWIKPVAPAYARKGGRSRKPPIRNG